MNVNPIIERLISEEQYIYSDLKKEEILLPIIKEQLKSHVKNNIHIQSWLQKLAVDIDSLQSLKDVPLLPTQMFKYFDLNTSSGPLQRVLYSSSTTSQTPSKVPICQTTARRQTKALLAIIKNYFSSQRRPFLVIDAMSSNKEAESITARGAAIRGFSILAKDTVYAFDEIQGRLVLNIDRVMEFFSKYSNDQIFALGFTYIVWSEFLTAVKKSGVSLYCPDLVLVHGGGWKKLKNQSVSKDIFNSQMAELFGTKPENILDFYGMVEQTGVVFIDCEEGYKHCPNFAEVKIRNFYSLKENDVNEPGFIEIMSVLPDSYPGMSILTEDVGEIVGYDHCPCGRRGKYFLIRNRLEESEIRGCGDTFRE